jgi:hypothetical protein
MNGIPQSVYTTGTEKQFVFEAALLWVSFTNPLPGRDSRPSNGKFSGFGVAALFVTWVFGGLLTGNNLPGIQTAAAADVDLHAAIADDRTAKIHYTVAIRGKIITPADDGTTELKLSSDAAFDFAQRQFRSQLTGPFSLRAYRRFQTAAVDTLVGPDYRTKVQLPQSHRLLQVYGTDTTLLHLSTDVHLSRQQVDLLQLPFDPLVAAGLLPARTLGSNDEKWNAESWVVPLLVGMEAAVSQSVTCQIAELTESTAIIRFEGKAEGAVNGSASSVSLDGQLTVDRAARVITSLKSTLREKRSPGTVSPGLEVTADVQWTQAPAGEDVDLPRELPETLPAGSSLLLTLPTPWRLLLLHSRDWHLFHETPELVMLRMLHNGSLIGQCNITPAATLPPGEFTPDAKFRAEVQMAPGNPTGRNRRYESPA